MSKKLIQILSLSTFIGLNIGGTTECNANACYDLAKCTNSCHKKSSCINDCSIVHSLPCMIVVEGNLAKKGVKNAEERLMQAAKAVEKLKEDANNDYNGWLEKLREHSESVDRQCNLYGDC